MINLEKYQANSQASKKKYKVVKISIQEAQSQKNLQESVLDKSPLMQKKRIKKKSKSK